MDKVDGEQNWLCPDMQELPPQHCKPWDNHPPLSTTSDKELTGSQRVPR